MNPETQQEPSKAEEKMPLVYRLYGLFSIILGAYTLFAVVMFAALMTWALQTDPSMTIVGTDFTLPVVLLVISYVITFANGIALIAFGRMLRKGSRRNAARISHALIAASVVQILFKLMLQGVDLTLIPDAIQLFLLIAVSVTVDPSLKQERALERHVRDMVDREAAEEGMLGRDLEGKGFIELNFFNLFWVFVICCFLGLIIETVYHFVIVVPGEVQDRAPGGEGVPAAGERARFALARRRHCVAILAEKWYTTTIFADHDRVKWERSTSCSRKPSSFSTSAGSITS